MDWNFGDVLLTMLAFFFWFTFVWMFIGVFADIFRRHDLSGGAKAGWLFLVVVLPLLGVLLYTIARPPLTVEDAQRMEAASRGRESARYSVADEVAKLAELRSKGAISEEEFGRLKAQAMA